MLNKTIIGVGIVGIVLVSLASAGLVGFLSNSVSGSVEVSGPVFYLDKEDIMGDKSFSLKLNDNNVIKNGTFTLGKSYKLREFVSESLGVDDFYEQDFLVTLDAKAVNYSVNDSGGLLIEVDILKKDGTPRNIELCSIGFMQIKGRKDYPILCETKSNDLSDMNPSDRIRLSLRDWSSSNVNEKIFIYGDSKMEVVVKDE